MRYINGHIFYEYVFDVSDDKTNKYNTFVCYSFKNIRFDYDLKLILSKKQITFLNTKIFINVIYDYEYSIRPCAFKNLLYLINIDTTDGKRDKDYHFLMSYIKGNRMSLMDIIDNDIDLEFQPNGYYDILTKSVVARSLELCKKRVQFVENDYSGNMLLSEKQKDILTNAFKRSSISLVTGAAGTGKTTLIKEFIKNNTLKRILCLTTTNTANNNLKIKDCVTEVKYMNIAQFKKEREHAQFDIIIVDEASFVSTEAINDILSAYNNSAFLFVGDPEQIESIEFGNWFDLLLNILQTQKVVYALEKEYRTDIKEISNIWTEVRTGKKKNILELLSAYEMTEKIKDNYEIFDVKEGEVVLCLNYDGLYGINNINRYLQASNPNEAHEYQENLYKEGDPVIFIINDYSTYGIYNNLKGKIESINEDDDNIAFKIRLYDKIGYFGRLADEIRIIEEDGIPYAIVKKMKYHTDEYDSDMDSRTKLPFQIAYAMSIHKAQGLEFDSVKTIITKEADESITKNIFYTAVTRAKNKLKVYWEPEVANYVLDNIENSVKAQKVDLSIIGEQMKKNR